MTQDELKSIVNYNADTGIFTWKVRASNASKVGDLCGTLMSIGYIRLTIKWEMILAHRAAWLYVYGQMPSGDIDHINGVRSDNRIVNLRDVPRRLNLQNRAPSKDGRLLGTHFCKSSGKWIAQIQVDGKKKRLGTFTSEIEAHNAYVREKRAVHQCMERINQDLELV
jgi:HNH endonuclease